MGADLHIHVFSDGELSEKHFRAFFSNSLGSKWFGPRSLAQEEKTKEDLEQEVEDTPSVWVGEVSWLKAALFDDAETFIPAPIGAVHDTIGEDWPRIDDTLIAQIDEAMRLPNDTAYALASAEDVLNFLRANRGKRAFTVSW